MGIKNVGRV